MKVLVTGAAGQAGRALARNAPKAAEIVALERAKLDIANATAVARIVAEHAPDLIINAAAFTSVDAAETHAADAFRANAQGPEVLAQISAERGVRLIHISTDFVFDGAAGRPYRPDAATHPLGIYGRSKLQGEQAIRAHAACAAVIVRTAWLYDAAGRNFVRTMLKLMKERGAVRVVADQVGCPTSADSLARALWAFAARPQLRDVYHWTDEGVASWYDFAVAIKEEAQACSLLPDDVAILAIATAEYPTAAQRPAYSVLDKSSSIEALEYRPQHWRSELRAVVKELSLG
jgi:dTDP-4-dehydrorhamnose reductase